MSVTERVGLGRDIFRSSRRRIQFSLWVIRGLGFLILALMVQTLVSAAIPGVFDFTNLQVFFIVIFLLVFSLILATFTLIGTFMAFLISFIPFVTIPQNQLSAELVFVTRAFVEKVLFSSIDIGPTGLDKDAFLGTGTDPIAPLAYLLNKPQRELYNTAFVNGTLYFALILLIVAAVNFLFRGNTTQAISAFLLAQFIIGYGYMKDRFIPLSLQTGTVADLLGSSMFQIGFITYLFLEYSLQTSYLSSIARPNLERQARVQKQIERLQKFKLGMEDQTKTSSQKMNKDEGSEERTSSELSAGSSGSTTARKFGAEALMFLLESAHDSVLARPEGEQQRLNVRLQRYYDGLTVHDLKLPYKLGGTAGKTFNPLVTLIYIVLSSGLRITGIIFLTWLIINPKIFFSSINFPPTLVNSIEFEQPEGLLLVLIPIIFLVMGISILLIRILNYSRSSEELIIEEHEIQEIIKRGKAISSREQYESMMKEETPPQTKEQTPKKATRSKQPKRRRRKQR